MVVVPDIEHECENGVFLERKIIPSGIEQHESIQAADVAMTQHEYDRGLAVGIKRDRRKRTCWKRTARKHS